jgi:hypothetical protein
LVQSGLADGASLEASVGRSYGVSPADVLAKEMERIPRIRVDPPSKTLRSGLRVRGIRRLGARRSDRNIHRRFGHSQNRTDGLRGGRADLSRVAASPVLDDGFCTPSDRPQSVLCAFECLEFIRDDSKILGFQ